MCWLWADKSVDRDSSLFWSQTIRTILAVTNYTILTVTNYTIFVTSIHAFYFSEVLYSVLLTRYQLSLDILVWFQSLLDIFIFIYKVLMLPIWLNNWINCCWVKEFSNPNRNNPLVVLLSGLIFFLLLFFSFPKTMNIMTEIQVGSCHGNWTSIKHKWQQDLLRDFLEVLHLQRNHSTLPAIQKSSQKSSS